MKRLSIKRTTVYPVLLLLLFAGFLASCSSGTQEAVEEQTTFATYAFEAVAGNTTLAGSLELNILDNGEQREATGALILDDGTRLLAHGVVYPQSIEVVFHGDNLESLGADTLNIFGFGILGQNGSYSGNFNGDVDGQPLVGTWTATPTSQGDEPGDDTGGDETGGGDTGGEETGGGDTGGDETGGSMDPPSDPGDDSGDTEPGFLQVNLTIVSENVRGKVIVEQITEDGKVEVAVSEFENSGQGSSSEQTIEQSVSPGEYVIRVRGRGFENQKIYEEIDAGEEVAIDIEI